MNINMKSKKRTRLRLFAGKLYYTAKRYIEWFFLGKKYAKSCSSDILPYTVFEHETPLFRKLKDVDMWLQYNKVNNLRIAVSRLDGIIIYAGETFSFWRLVGRPTESKGYLRGMAIVNGKVEISIGGGLCQLTNLIYWMALHTPLKVIERYRHAFDVFPDSDRTQPFGSGATCVYNYRDLQIKNETEAPFQLKLRLTKDQLCGMWASIKPLDYTYKVYEKRHWITHEFWGAYIRHNEIYRSKHHENELLLEESVAENHAIMMYPTFLHKGN